MKFREIFRFELVYQLRRIPTWLYFAVLLFSAFINTAQNFLPDARSGDGSDVRMLTDDQFEDGTPSWLPMSRRR